jgi:hypothetical protein
MQGDHMRSAFYNLAAWAAVLPVAGISASLRAQEPAPAAQPSELVSIDYKMLYRQLMQLGMVSQVLGYSLKVDADGKVTDCSFSRRFARRYTREQLCKAVVTYTELRPARDAAGNAVVGTYEGEIEVASFFQPSR